MFARKCLSVTSHVQCLHCRNLACNAVRYKRESHCCIRHLDGGQQVEQAVSDVTWCLCTNIHGVTVQKTAVLTWFFWNVQHAEPNVGQFRTIADVQKCLAKLAYRVTQNKWDCWGFNSGPWSFFLINWVFCIVVLFVYAEQYFIFMNYCFLFTATNMVRAVKFWSCKECDIFCVILYW